VPIHLWCSRNLAQPFCSKYTILTNSFILQRLCFGTACSLTILAITLETGKHRKIMYKVWIQNPFFLHRCLGKTLDLTISSVSHCDLTMSASEIICVVTHPSSNRGRSKATHVVISYWAISRYCNIACTALNSGYMVAGGALSMLPSCSCLTTLALNVKTCSMRLTHCQVDTKCSIKHDDCWSISTALLRQQ